MKKIASLYLANAKTLLSPALAFIDQVCAHLKIESGKAMKFRLACEEILHDRLTNAYAEQGEVRVDILLSSSSLEVSVVDKGAPYWKDKNRYNPQAVDSAAQGLEDFLMAHMADRVGMEKLGRHGQRFFLQTALPTPWLPERREAREEEPLDRDFQIRPTGMDDEDIIRAIACIHNEYGYTYGYERLYYPERFRELIGNGDFHSFLTVNAHGQVAGHYGLAFSDVHPGMPEMATVVVKRAFRRNNLFDAMVRHVVDVAASLDMHALCMQPTAYHTATQRLALRYGFAATGFLFHYTNADMESEYNKDGSRLSLAIAVKVLHPKDARVVYAPPQTRAFLETVYGRLGVARTFGAPTEARGSSELKSEMNPLMRSGKMVVWRVGGDFAEELQRLTEEFRRNKIEMLELLLPLDDAATPVAYDAAVALGYCFTGLIPCGGRGDLLVLQHLMGDTPNVATLTTEGEFTETLALLQDIWRQ